MAADGLLTPRVAERAMQQLLAHGPDGAPHACLLAAGATPLVQWRCAACDALSHLASICAHCGDTSGASLEDPPRWAALLQRAARHAALRGKRRREQDPLPPPITIDVASALQQCALRAVLRIRQLARRRTVSRRTCGHARVHAYMHARV